MRWLLCRRCAAAVGNFGTILRLFDLGRVWFGRYVPDGGTCLSAGHAEMPDLWSERSRAWCVAGASCRMLCCLWDAACRMSRRWCWPAGHYYLFLPCCTFYAVSLSSCIFYLFYTSSTFTGPAAFLFCPGVALRLALRLLLKPARSGPVLTPFRGKESSCA